MRHSMTNGYRGVSEPQSPKKIKNPTQTQNYPQQGQISVSVHKIKEFAKLWHFHTSLNSDSIGRVREQEVVESIYTIHSQSNIEIWEYQGMSLQNGWKY